MEIRSKRRSYVYRLLEECDRLIEDTLLELPSARPVEAVRLSEPELFIEHDAAWEAALRDAPRADLIVVGPDCTLRVTSEVQGHCAATNTPSIVVPCDTTEIYLTRQTHQAKLLSQLKTAVGNAQSVTIIISHVSYSTGLTTPLGQFLEQLKADLSRSLYVIVDGTNAVGNRCRVPVEAGWDAYVFSAEKWLLAPESVSILLSKGNTNPLVRSRSLKGDRRSYDSVIGAVAGFRASLEVLRSNRLDYFWQRCEALRGAFIAGLPKTVRVIGTQRDEETSFIVSCYPAGTGAWRRNIEQMNDALGRICDSASVLVIDENRPWVRITFPYYLDPRDLNRVNAFLEDNTSD